jgi:hypothetical protein
VHDGADGAALADGATEATVVAAVAEGTVGELETGAAEGVSFLELLQLARATVRRRWSRRGRTRAGCRECAAASTERAWGDELRAPHGGNHYWQAPTS